MARAPGGNSLPPRCANRKEAPIACGARWPDRIGGGGWAIDNAADRFPLLAGVLAVSSGIWAFNQGLILGVLLGPLPAEELPFFLITNTLIIFSGILLVSRKSLTRFRLMLVAIRSYTLNASRFRRRSPASQKFSGIGESDE
jgi:hypothetical protein